MVGLRVLNVILTDLKNICYYINSSIKRNKYFSHNISKKKIVPRSAGSQFLQLPEATSNHLLV